MSLSEFDIIQQFFKRKRNSRKDVLLGIGDDAALLKVPSKQVLAISMDTLSAGIHFPINTKPYDIGYKSLAVNLSDLAAIAAIPSWVTLALTLPAINKKWLTEFCKGFFTLIDQYKLQLVGGDITHGDCLSITVQIHGFVTENKALRRTGANPGDAIYVTGTLGDAGLALALLKQASNKIPTNLLQRLNRPTPRVQEGLALTGIANSAIDLSDGLIGDLKHILTASKVGATVLVDNLPLSKSLKQYCDESSAIEFALSSGDDYELCFTVPTAKEKKLRQVFKKFSCGISRVGIIEKKTGLRLQYQNGQRFLTNKQGFRHF